MIFSKFFKLFIDLYNNFLFDPTFRFHFEQPTYLYLKYRLEPVKNLFLCSNVLFHLFNCPRSNYAVSNYCSHLYIDPLFDPSSDLRYEFIFVNRAFKEDVKLLLKSHFITQFKLNICYKSLKHYNVINTDQERCLTIPVIQDPCKLIITFCEMLVRILYIFFYYFLLRVYSKKGEYFYIHCLKFIKKFFQEMTKLLHAHPFKNMFLNYEPDVDYSASFIKVINQTCLFLSLRLFLFNSF